VWRSPRGGSRRRDSTLDRDWKEIEDDVDESGDVEITYSTELERSRQDCVSSRGPNFLKIDISSSPFFFMRSPSFEYNRLEGFRKGPVAKVNINMPKIFQLPLNHTPNALSTMLRTEHRRKKDVTYILGIPSSFEQAENSSPPPSATKTFSPLGLRICSIVQEQSFSKKLVEFLSGFSFTDRGCQVPPVESRSSVKSAFSGRESHIVFL
jgi:hypothetical protein